MSMKVWKNNCIHIRQLGKRKACESVLTDTSHA